MSKFLGFSVVQETYLLEKGGGCEDQRRPGLSTDVARSNFPRLSLVKQTQGVSSLHVPGRNGRMVQVRVVRIAGPILHHGTDHLHGLIYQA